jgi:hypothetical protein
VLNHVVGAGNGELKEVEDAVENGEEEGVEDVEEGDLRSELCQHLPTHSQLAKREKDGERKDCSQRTLYFATNRPRKLSSSASSGKVISPTRQSMKVGMRGRTA